MAITFNGSTGANILGDLHVNDGGDRLHITAGGTGARLIHNDNSPMIFGTFGVERMSIDFGGRVTMPYQPMASVTKNNGVGWATVNRTEVYNVAFTNTGNHYNTATGLFTCPVAGRYRVLGGSLAKGQYAIHIRPQKNGANINLSGAHANSTGDGGYYTMSVEYIVDCAANDTLSIHVYSSGPGYYDTSEYPFALFQLIG